MQIVLSVNAAYTATVAQVDFKEEKGKHISSMSVQMKNGTLMASALHLFVTQLEPEVKLLKRLDFSLVNMIIFNSLKFSIKPWVLIFSFIHAEMYFGFLAPHEQHVTSSH